MNKYYANAVFCPKCRMMVDDKDFIYECDNGLDGDAEHKTDFYAKTGTSEVEIATSDGGFHYYFRRPPLTLFKTDPKFAVCPVCRTPSTNIVCPDCYSKLISTAHRTEVISVVGIKGCGKSVYISALVDCIKAYLNYNNINVTHVSESVKNYTLRPGQKLPGGTPSGQIDPIQLHIGSKGRDDRYPLDLLIYDIAGEDLKKTGAAAMELFRHLAMSSLIIYLFDSLTDSYHIRNEDWKKRPELKAHRSRCLVGEDLNNESIIIEIVDQVRKRHRMDLRKTSNRTLPIYLAGCLSSTDFLQWAPEVNGQKAPGLNDPDAETFYDYYYCFRPINLLSSANDKTEIDRLQKESSNAIRDQLFAWDEHSSLSQLENNFKKYAYFGVSALGRNPEVKGDDFICPDNYTARSARNVVNPVAWFLEDSGLLKSLKK